MTHYDVIEFIAVNQDQLTEQDIYQAIDALSDRQLLDLSEYIWRHNTGLPGSVVNQIQGIHSFFSDTGFITKDQRIWLGMNAINYWDRLTITARQLID